MCSQVGWAILNQKFPIRKLKDILKVNIRETAHIPQDRGGGGGWPVL